MVFANIGFEPLAWTLATNGIEGLDVTPTAGTVDAQGTVLITVSYASARTFSRAAPYEGNVTFTAISGVCKCKPQELSVNVKLEVSASASAANSEIAFTNAAKVATSGNLEFEIDPIDSTGMALRDASNVAYFAELAHPSSSRRRLQDANVSLCEVKYSGATTKRHEGECVLPERITGTFTLTVFDIETAVVGMLNVTVSRCAAGLYADADGVCVECTKRLDCLRSGRTLANLPIKPGGYRFDETTEIVRNCLMGERACPGGNGTSDALCARGYEGPLCAVCSEGFILGRGNKCIECASSSAIASISVPLTVLAVLFVAVVLACVSDVVKPLFEYVWSSFGTQSRILWAFTQILAHIPILLSAILPATLRGFYLVWLKITDLNPFAAFGLSCANHAFRSFKTRLVFAITAPIVLSAALLAYALLQVYVLRRNAEKCFTRYAHLQLIVLFLVLPGVSTTTFRTFLCDTRFVEDKSVSFLEADLTLSCESTEYKQLEVLAFIGLLLYPVGVNALYAGLLFRARDAIQHRDGAGAEHLSFLFRSYGPKSFAFDVVDSLRRILLSGGLVFISERGRAAGGTMIALFFCGLYENVKPYKHAEANVIASIANGAIAVVMLLLTILQGELMPKSTVGNLCIIISLVIFPVIAAYQLRSIKRREAALAALETKTNGRRAALHRQPSTTIGFTETFSVA